jgi:hypothetical protein
MSQEALVGGLVIGSAALVVSGSAGFHAICTSLITCQVGNPIMQFTSPFVGIAFPTYQTCACHLLRNSVCKVHDV